MGAVLSQHRAYGSVHGSSYRLRIGFQWLPMELFGFASCFQSALPEPRFAPGQVHGEVMGQFPASGVLQIHRPVGGASSCSLLY
jgi:hypothetical protein